jgi:hypothetical protein
VNLGLYWEEYLGYLDMIQQIRKMNFGFEMPEEESLSRDEIADRLGEEMVQMLEDLMLCP